ncbi:MAG: TetR/AcrR family transcriptional regulator [Solirubrobacteraceae bacterium]
MATASAETTSARRTQAERRGATRAALLDATIDCIVEEGYANTTTRAIAQRAGVTPGALQHHFATKTELLSQARRHISKKIVQELAADRPDTALPIQERTEWFLDRVWDLFKGPLFHAGMELWVASRTNSELRSSLVDVQRYGAHAIIATGPVLYPELARRPGLAELIATGQATMRGLALLRFVNDADADRVWPATRAHLLALTLQFSREAGQTP